MNPLIRQELKQRRWSIIWWIVGISAFVVLEMAFYPTVKNQAAELEKSFSKLSDSTVALFSDTGDFFSPVGYLSGQIFYLMLPLLLGVLAIGLGSSLLGREERDRTLELLLSKPLSRKKIIYSKAAAGGIIVFLVGFVASLVVAAMAKIVGLPVGITNILLTGLLSTILAICFGSIAFLFTIIGKGLKKASVGIAAFYALTGYLLSSLSANAEWLKWPSKTFVFAYYKPAEILEGRYAWANAIFIIIIPTICILLSRRVFKQRDIV